jgi:hypothetical protein
MIPELGSGSAKGDGVAPADGGSLEVFHLDFRTVSRREPSRCKAITMMAAASVVVHESAADNDGFRGERPQSDARATSGDSCGEVPRGPGVTVKDFPASPAQSLGGPERT